MRVDEARRERRVAQVDDLGPGGDREVRPDGDDLRPLDEDHPIRPQRVGLAVEEPGGLQGDDRRGLRILGRGQGGWRRTVATHKTAAIGSIGLIKNLVI